MIYHLPKRIQRQRTRGWRMPAGAVYVGRPTIWGNPFKVIDDDHRRAVNEFYRWLYSPYFCPPRLEAERERLLDRLPELRGRDLACWCPLQNRWGDHHPCHADVLLRLANQPMWAPGPELLPGEPLPAWMSHLAQEEICYV